MLRVVVGRLNSGFAKGTAEVLRICNKGDAALDVASVVYEHSLLFGDSYHAKGWYNVDPGKCETVYSDDQDPTDW